MNTLELETDVNKFKRKKKKSYLSRAKKFGKSGRFGKGAYISEDSYNYFVRVMELHKGKFDSDEERGMFVTNTFEQTHGQEVLLSSNQFTSVVLEQLIAQAKNEPLDKFRAVLGEDLRPICSDPFASHVIQSLLKASALKINDTTEDDPEEGSWHEKHIAWIVKVARFLLNNLDEFVWDEYANHIIRTAVELSSGYFAPAKGVTGSVSIKKMPKELRNVLKDFVKTIAALPQLADLTSSPLTSGLLQTVVQAAGRSGEKRIKPLSARVLEVLKDKGSKLDNPSLRLLEALADVAPPQLYSTIWECFFKSRLQELACDPDWNFSVQRLLDSCPDKEQVQPLLEEINTANGIKAVIDARHTGVVVALAKACQRLGAAQGNFIQNLMEALECASPTERQMQIAPLVLSLCTYEKYHNSATPPPTLHGSVVLQTLLHFNKPIKVRVSLVITKLLHILQFVQSLLAMETSKLAQVLADTKGSHVTDAFMSSPYVGEKSREKLCQVLKGHWTELACSVFGSRSLDALWRASNLKARQQIVGELAQNISALKGDKHGRFIEQSCGVELFKRKPLDWAEAQTKSLTTKRLFADILDPTPTARKKSKKE